MSTHLDSLPFVKMVEGSLKRFKDQEWLGNHSPLAQPFMLSRYEEAATINSPQSRGKILQSLIEKSMEELDGKYGEEYQALLQERYVKGNNEESISNTLLMSRSSIFSKLKAARIELATILEEKLQPALVIESPPRVSDTIYQRNKYVEECLLSLNEKKTVVLTGAGGIGKTTLGSLVAQRWQTKHVCWFTVRLGINDHLDILFRNIGYFFRQLNLPVLWHEIWAGKGEDLDSVLGILRYTIGVFKQKYNCLPLLCVDEVDRLDPGERGEHAAVVEFIRGLRGYMPVLLMGKRVAIEADYIVTLGSISPNAVKQWIIEAGIRLSTDDLERVNAFTEGNPQLIDLFVASHQIDQPLSSLLSELSGAPTVEHLLNRIVSRLEKTEFQVLKGLSVIEGVAPQDVWHTNVSKDLQRKLLGALDKLIANHLVQTDGRGGIWILPAYREIIMDAVPADERTQLHVNAAYIFAERGQYAVAAYHYSHSPEPENAIRFWHQFQQQAINQGEAHAALRVFLPLLKMSLPQEETETLQLICERLKIVRGELPESIPSLRTAFYQTPILAIEAEELAGIVNNDLRGGFPAARQHFRQALKLSEDLVEARMARIHKGLGWGYLRENNGDAAWEEAQRAAYEVENFKGLILEESYCQYEEAELHYKQALEIAEELNHKEGIAKTANNLLGVYARTGQFEKAYRYGGIAQHTYEMLGKSRAQIGAKITLCFAQNLAGEHELALTTAQAAERSLQEWHVDDEWLQTLLHQCLAETYLGLNALDSATQYAQSGIDSEVSGILSDANRTLAEVLLIQNKTDKALAHASDALKYARTDDDQYMEAYALRTQGRIHRVLKNHAEAQNCFDQAIQIFTEINLLYEVSETQN